MATRNDRDQTWRKLADGSMELVEDHEVVRELPPPPLESRVDTIAAEVAAMKDIDQAYQNLLIAREGLRVAGNSNQIRDSALVLADAVIAWAAQVMAAR